MPFVNEKHRKNPDPLMPGDRCYLQYKKMVSKWKEKPCWTTADAIYQETVYQTRGIIDTPLEEIAALELAWQVFFIKHVMPYEDMKEKLNGTI